MTFETTWNGTRSREGTCPSLSGYQGSSSLESAIAKRGIASWKGMSTILRAKRKPIYTGPLPTPAAIKYRLKCGFSLQNIARKYEIPISTVRRLAARA